MGQFSSTNRDKLINVNSTEEKVKDEIIIEGYLEKQSLHLKQFRKRFISLRDKYLYCYKNDKMNDHELTEVIDLRQYDSVKISENDQLRQIQLIPHQIDKKSKRIFNASSISQSDFENWIKALKQTINDENYELDYDEKDDNVVNDNKINMHNDQQHIIINNTNDTMIEYDNGCDDITDCNSLDRLIQALKYHKMHENDNDQLSEYFNVNKKFIINDYHHILVKHSNNDNDNDNKQFQYIYNTLIHSNNLLCDIRECVMYKRNNRERQKDQNNINSSTRTAIEILDTIHCCFIHSIDTGHTIVDQLENNDTHINDNDDENIYIDRPLITLKTHLKSKRTRLEQVRGIRRMNNNKFHTNIEVDLDDNDNKSNTEDEETRNEYSFGVRYDCWDSAKDLYDYKLSAKYVSLKDEILSNSLYNLQANAFNNAYEKAVTLLNDSNIIKNIQCTYEYSDNAYGVKLCERLKISNILSITLYTDFDNLQYNFSLIFRDKTKEKEVGNEYYHWIKILTETINCYGEMMKDTNIVLYHGVSYLYFDSFIATFNSPTSTTPRLQVATIFAKNDGIILELYTSNVDPFGLSGELRYFNCNLMSSFPAEDEKLFIQPPMDTDYYLKFKSIRNMQTGENYADFINILSEFQKIVDSHKHGSLTTDWENDLNNVVSSSLIDSINNLIVNHEQYPSYIDRCFMKWTNTMTNLSMNISEIKDYYFGLNIFNRLNNNLVPRLDRINKIFKQIEEIDCFLGHSIDLFYLNSLLQEIKLLNQISDSRLKKICVEDISIECLESEISQTESLFKEFKQNGWNIKIVSDHIGDCIEITR